MNQTVINLASIDTISNSFFFHVTRIRKAIVSSTTLLLTEASIKLKIEQLPILIILQKGGTVSQRELSDITLRDKSSIARSVSALLKKGLLVVKQDSVDKRKNKLFLSPEGKKLSAKIAKLMRKAEDDALSVFPEGERAIAFQTIKSYADKLERN